MLCGHISRLHAALALSPRQQFFCLFYANISYYCSVDRFWKSTSILFFDYWLIFKRNSYNINLKHTSCKNIWVKTTFLHISFQTVNIHFYMTHLSLWLSNHSKLFILFSLPISFHIFSSPLAYWRDSGRIWFPLNVSLK